MEGLRPYPAVKDSRVEWMGPVPEHWAVQPSKTLLSSVTGGSWGSDPGVDAVDALCIRGTDFNHVSLTADVTKAPTRSFSENDIRRRGLRRGDLVLSTSGGNSAQAVGAVVQYLADEVALPTNFATRLTPSSKVNSQFLTYVYYSMNKYGMTQRLTNQVTIANLDVAQYLRIPVPLPPLSEQGAIVRFLDYADRRIRHYVAAKRKLIALLDEQKQAIIHQAVTRGLDPTVPLRSAGVESLGEVPAHWDVIRTAVVCDFLAGKAHEPFMDPDGEFICVTARFISTDGQSVRHCSKNLCPAKLGDVLMVMSDLPRGRALARAFHVDDDGKYAVNQRVCVLRAHSMNSQFLAHCANRNPQLLAHDDGFNQTHLPNAAFKTMKVPVPPLEEQAAIVAAIEVETVTIGKAVVRSLREIELIEEYRKRLIADVVSGKFDVRDAALGLPDEVPESAQLATSLEGDELDPASSPDVPDGEDEG